MIHLAELFFMMFPSKPSCSSGISSPATLTKENRTQISHSFYTRISTVSHFTWLNPPPPKKRRKQRKDIQGWGSLAKCSEEAGTFPPGHEWILIVLLYYNSIMEHGLYDVLWCSMFICMFIVLWYVHCWFSIETMVEYMFTVIVVAWSLTGFTHMYQCMYWPFRSYRPIGLQRFIIKVVYAVPPRKVKTNSIPVCSSEGGADKTPVKRPLAAGCVAADRLVTLTCWSYYCPSFLNL